MAHNGFKVFDSDMHVQEPPDLWTRYIDPKFKDQAPLGTTNYLGDQDLIHEGKIISRFKVQAPHQGELTEWFTDHYERRKIYEDFDRRDWVAETQIEAMDAEGIDVAVLFPTRGLFAHAKEYDDDEFAAAVSRAYNDWLADFCAHDPERMYGAAMVPAQNVPAAVAELPLTPTEYFKRQCYVGVEADEEPGKYTLDWLGDSNVVFSTDFPHPDSKFPGSVKALVEQPFPEASMRKILWDNCCALYDIE